MSKINSALEFLKEDIDKVHEQFVGSEQWMSLLQRNQVTLQDLLDKFDPQSDDDDWEQEYSDKMKKREPKLTLFRKRMAFLKASRKEFIEDYNPEVTDVDFMRLMEVPYTDSKFAIDFSIEEMKEKD